MKFKLRKKTGANGTEVIASVSFSPDDEQGIIAVCDDATYQLNNLRIEGNDGQRADHALTVLRILIHYVDLWSMRDSPTMRAHISHGKQRRRVVEKAQRRKRK